MILTILTGLCVIMGSIFIALAGKTMSPDLTRFFCVNWKVRGILTFYAIILFIRGVLLVTGATREHDPSFVRWDAFAGSLGMVLTHGVMFTLILRQRLPPGVWMRLQRRQERVAKVADAPGKQGPALARLAAENIKVVAPLEGPEVIIDYARER